VTTDPARAMPPEFPLALADRLRAAGVVLVVDEQLFVDRRRRETVTELEGIRPGRDRRHGRGRHDAPRGNDRRQRPRTAG
jgi:hypothetical protein